VVSVRLDPRFKKVVIDGYNTLAVLFEDDRVGAGETARASLVFDGRDGRLDWFSYDRSGSTDEPGGRPLIAILSIARDDEGVRRQILDATKKAKTFARRRVRALRASGTPADERVARNLERAIKAPWLRPPK
jgi:hypothetical protein